MIGYVTIGALDVEASAKFYDTVFAALGIVRTFTGRRSVGYGRRRG